MPAIPDKCVDVSIGDAEVRALLVRTGEALGLYPLGGPSAAFHLTPGTYWRRLRFHNGRVGAGEAAVWAIVWGAGPQQTVEHAALGPTPLGGRLRKEPLK